MVSAVGVFLRLGSVEACARVEAWADAPQSFLEPPGGLLCGAAPLVCRKAGFKRLGVEAIR